MSNLNVNEKHNTNYTHTNNTPRKEDLAINSDVQALDDNKSKGIENNLAVNSDDS